MNAGLISISFSEIYKHSGNGTLYKNIFLFVLLSVARGIEGASIIYFHWLLQGLSQAQTNFNFLFKKLFINADSLRM